MRKTRLFTPGPTPLIPQAQLAGAMQLMHHRTPEFKNLVLKTRANLQAIFQTRHEVVILTSSGTGAMEAAISNLHAPGEKVVAVVAGKFGERWVELAEAFGLECIPIHKEYGEAASPDEILNVLRDNPGVSSLLLQGCETSTATSHDLETIGLRVSREFPEILLIIDGITAIGSQEVRPDEWGLDVVISSSQKAFGVPPGLAMVCVSPEAVAKMKSLASPPRYYLNLLRELEGQAKGSTGFTPAVTLVNTLYHATEEMLKEGVARLIASAEQMARATRKGLVAMGFRLLSSAPANAATAAFPPPGISAEELSRALESEFGIKVAGGQGPVKGKIIRVAHLGYFDIFDMVTVLSAIELCLVKAGLPTRTGAGVCAALDEVRKD